MRLSQWLNLVAIMMILAGLRVAQQNAVFSRAYALGASAHRAYQKQRDVAWLRSEVAGLESPVRLAAYADEHDLKLVAWKRIDEMPLSESPLMQFASAESMD